MRKFIPGGGYLISRVNENMYLLYDANELIGHIQEEFCGNIIRIGYQLIKGKRVFGYEKLLFQMYEYLKSQCMLMEKTVYVEVKRDDVYAQRNLEGLGYVGTEGEYIYIYKKNRFSKDILNHIEVKKCLENYVLILSNNRNVFPFCERLHTKTQIVLESNKISLDYLRSFKPYMMISYNYKYRISEEIIEYMEDNIINLHISYLPWNKGSNPNFWSFVEDTPKGVSIHKIDKGLDTGDVLIQKQVYFDESKETFRSTYEYLNTEIIRLLEENWHDLKNGRIAGVPQIGEGSSHTLKEFNEFLNGSSIQWDENILDFKKRMGII